MTAHITANRDLLCRPTNLNSAQGSYYKWVLPHGSTFSISSARIWSARDLSQVSELNNADISQCPTQPALRSVLLRILLQWIRKSHIGGIKQCVLWTSLRIKASLGKRGKHRITHYHFSRVFGRPLIWYTFFQLPLKNPLAQMGLSEYILVKRIQPCLRGNNT